MMKRFGVIRGVRHWYVIDYKHGGEIIAQWELLTPAKMEAEIRNRRRAT